MYKLKFSIALLIFLLVLPGLSYAADSQTTDKKNIAIIIVNNPKESWIKDDAFNNLLINPAIQRLSDRFIVSANAKYYEKFKSAGLYSIIDLEKSDIVDVLKDENIDYAVLIQTSSHFVSGTLDYNHSRMKIIDVKTNKILYNENFAILTVKPYMEQTVKIIDERLPKN